MTHLCSRKVDHPLDRVDRRDPQSVSLDRRLDGMVLTRAIKRSV